MSNLRVRYLVGNEQKVVILEPREVRLGRGTDNDIVLPDFSVSRRHAALRFEDGAWWVHDLDSTNGVQLNGEAAKQARFGVGDSIKMGIFVLEVERAEEAEQEREDSAIPSATIVRPLSHFTGGLDLELPDSMLEPLEDDEDSEVKKPAAQSDELAGTGGFFKYFNMLARELIKADTAEQVLEKVMDIAFQALPVDRGVILVGETVDSATCALMRTGEEVVLKPQEDVPVSRTILRTVMEEQVGLLSLDALDDSRLAGGKSIMLHGIRAAMCAPLWAQKKISGFIQVDSPFEAGKFNETHLDFLITLANYAAVGVQRSEERRKRGRLERYHSPSVVDEVMSATDAEGGTRLRKKDVTVLFGDLVGFTAFSESGSLEQVTELLEGYFDRSVNAIFEHGGTLDKYIGDCVMAFFGAPMDQQDHAERAVRAAVEIQKRMLIWNQERESQGLPAVHCRLAVNTGPVVVGDIGSGQRVDYTVLGNTVNVAARLESSAAGAGDVVIGEATFKQLADDFPAEHLGEFTLKGLQQKVNVYRVPVPGSPAEKLAETHVMPEEGIEALREEHGQSDDSSS